MANTMLLQLDTSVNPPCGSFRWYKRPRSRRYSSKINDDYKFLNKIICRYEDMFQGGRTVKATDTELQVIGPDSGATALLHPLRRQILENLAEANSASGVSRRLELPRQKVNYHLRELEKAGLVEFVEERRKGNCVERIVRASARSYVISPDTLGTLAADPERVRDRFSSAYLIALATRALGELGLLRTRAAATGKRLATLSLETEVRFSSASERQAFCEELTSHIAKLSKKYHDEGAGDGRSFKFLVAGYPSVKSEDETPPIQTGHTLQ